MFIITETSLRQHGDKAETSLKHHRHITDTNPRHHQRNNEKSTWHRWDTTKTSPRHHQSITKTPLAHHWDTMETSPRHHQSIAKTRPRQDRHILGENFPGACGSPRPPLRLLTAYRYWGISNGVIQKEVITHVISLIVHQNPSDPRWYSRTLAGVLWKWQHNHSGCCFRFHQQPTAKLASFIFIPDSTCQFQTPAT